MTQGYVDIRETRGAAQASRAACLAMAAVLLLFGLVVGAEYLPLGSGGATVEYSGLGSPLFIALRLAASLLLFAGYATATALFLLHLHKATWNASLLSSRPPRYPASFVVLCFFVPILNLWLPYRAVRELHDAQLAHDAEGNAALAREGRGLIGLWWGSNVLSVLAFMVAYQRLSASALGPEGDPSLSGGYQVFLLVAIAFMAIFYVLGARLARLLEEGQRRMRKAASRRA
jgi:hypothetical protein